MRLIALLLLGIAAAGAQDAPRVVTEQDRREVAAIAELAQKMGAENKVLKDELLDAQRSVISGLTETVTAQKKVIALNDDRNAQAAAKDAALMEVAALKVTIKKKEAEISKLKTILCFEAALCAVLICLYLGVPKYAWPWGLVATIAAPALVFGAVWAWL